MEGTLLSFVRDAARRLFRSADRAAFPATADPREHWQRQVMNAAVEARIAELEPNTKSAAEISGNLHTDRGWREYTALAWPDFDLSAPLTVKARFDVVICEQVLEHVPDPWAAAINLHELCRPGGELIVSTPFLVKLHEEAFQLDYWRFTPRGLRTLLEGAGFEVQTLESWGNRACVVGNFTSWSGHRRWHSLRNEPDFPLQVWAFARRPG
jgi:SAM-dependent methyltransferase